MSFQSKEESHGREVSLYIFDMTVSYFICKAVLDKMDEAEAQKELNEE